jgi:hypothetical protein
LAQAMLPIYALIAAMDPVRDFFRTKMMRGGDYLVVCLVAIAWILALRYWWKTCVCERFSRE